MGNNQQTLSVSDTSSSASFVPNHYYAEIYNGGANTVYVNFNATATTNHFPVFAGETLKIYTDIAAIHAICDTSLTSTLQIIATK
jgi:hypothetical protein